MNTKVADREKLKTDTFEEIQSHRFHMVGHVEGMQTSRASCNILQDKLSDQTTFELTKNITLEIRYAHVKERCNGNKEEQCTV